MNSVSQLLRLTRDELRMQGGSFQPLCCGTGLTLVGILAVNGMIFISMTTNLQTFELRVRM